ncbi:MAG: cell division protein ZapA [Acidiferrobacterales bacterium]|nr:cell division protein ZapA [Acidiferrobacterales bacterium]
MSNKGVNISIMGRDFSVACPADEQEDLLSAARYLDKSMKDIQKSGKIIGTERCAIMAALNITNDLLKLQRTSEGQQEMQQRLESLQTKIDEVLEEAESYQ